jgi:uncharacterized protein YjbI with pentapeptide repeats
MASATQGTGLQRQKALSCHQGRGINSNREGRLMKRLFSAFALVSFVSLTVQASEIDYQYRWANGGYRCVNAQNKEGYNKNYFGECGDVSGQILDKLNVHQEIKGLLSVGATYKRANFSNGTFHDCNFTNSELPSSNFSGTRLYKLNMEGTKLESALFSGVLMNTASFKKAQMQSSNFASSSIAYAQFESANLYYSTFAGSYIVNSSFENADLRDASLAAATLTDVSFKNADLRGTSFDGAQVKKGTSWKGARFNQYTRLPFSRNEAEQKGMIFE